MWTFFFVVVLSQIYKRVNPQWVLFLLKRLYVSFMHIDLCISSKFGWNFVFSLVSAYGTFIGACAQFVHVNTYAKIMQNNMPLNRFIHLTEYKMRMCRGFNACKPWT